MAKSTIGGKEIATTGSGHVSPGPPAVSLIPPTPPAGLVPAPFPYVAESKSASSTSSKVRVAGKPVLVQGSSMDVERPGNQPGQPPGAGDVVTHAVCGKANTTSGSSSVKAGGKGVNVTLDSVAMNVPSPCGKVAQSLGKLVGAADYNAKGADHAAMGAIPITRGEPVSVATGEVIDDWEDLATPGRIPVVWKRNYSSGLNRKATALGIGGFSHAYDQWVERRGNTLVLHNDDGREVHFPTPEPSFESFHRGRRMTLRRVGAEGVFEVYSTRDRLTRRYSNATADGPARLAEIVDAWGNRVTLSYDESGTHLERIVDTAAREFRVSHDAEGRVSRVEIWVDGVAMTHVAYDYQPTGELANVTNALGHAERYEYDGAHRLTKKTLRNGVSFYYQYDTGTERCRKSWGDGGLHAIELSFDDEAKSTTVTGLEPRVYLRNDRYAVVREETFDGDYAVITGYDDDLYVTAMSNAAGETLRYAYDVRGNRVRTQDAAGNMTHLAYDERDLVVRVEDSAGRVTQYGYGPQGAMESMLTPLGLKYTATYDAHGRVTGLYGPEGLLSVREYDASHNCVAETDARSGRTTYTYDALGRIESITQPTGGTTRFAFDALGQLVELVDPNGQARKHAYDALGNLTSETDALGRVIVMRYQGSGVLSEWRATDGQIWSFIYDKDERLVNVTNRKRETYTFVYDRAGRVIQEITFDGRHLHYQYNRAGRVARITSNSGSVRSFEYDLLGYVVQDRSPHVVQTFGRDARGVLRKATLTEASGTVEIAFERDAYGRVVAETQNGRRIEYAFDAIGRRAKRTLPSGHETHFSYDALGTPTAIRHGDCDLTFERDALGQERARTFGPNRVRVSTCYGPLGEPIEQAVAVDPGTHEGGEGIIKRDWVYDTAGRPVRSDDSRWGPKSYAYDDFDQLLSEATADSRHTYEYDAAGYLVRDTLHPNPTPDSSHWVTGEGSLLSQAGTVAYDYDDDHRRVAGHEQPGGPATKYFWDDRDRLREVLLPDGTHVCYIYDAFGRRVRKEVTASVPTPAVVTEPPDSVITEFLWDGDVVCAEYDPTGTSRVFVHEPWSFAPALEIDGDEIFAYVNDRLGAPTELLDTRGHVAWAVHRTAWGRVEAISVEVTNKKARGSPFGLAGQYVDDETSFGVTHYRVWDARVGRWLSADPLGIAGGLNLFGFPGAPTLVADPLGLSNKLFRGDDAYRAREPLGYTLNSPEADAADIQTPWDHVQRKQAEMTSRYTSFSEEQKKTANFGKAYKVNRSELEALETRGEIKILTREKVAEMMRLNGHTEKKIREIVAQMKENKEVLVEGCIPGLLECK